MNDSLKSGLSLLIAALLAGNLASTWMLNNNINQKMDQLIAEQSKIQTAVSNNQTQLAQMSSNMQDEFDRQASLFSESNSTVSYSAEGFVVTTTLTPKEYNTESKLTVTCISNGKSFSKEAVQNGSEFEAVCVVPYCETIDISAAISTGDSINQEPLPSIPCQTILAFDIYSSFSYEENMLYFTVSNQQGPALLDSLKGLQLSVLRDNTVIGSVYPKAIETSELPDSLKGNSSALCYVADLNPYIGLEGQLQICPKIQSTTGFSYSQDPLFLLTGSSTGLSSFESADSWYPPVFH